MAASGFLFDALPRPLRWLGLAVAGIALTGLFAIYRFDYDRVAAALSDQSESLVGIRLVLPNLGPSLMPGRIGMVATNVRAVLPRGETVMLPEVRVRPAASLGWLQGAPTFRVDVQGGGLGVVDGELKLGRYVGFDGKLDQVNLSLLPLDQIAADFGLDGIVDGTIDIVHDDEGRPNGTIEFEAANGSLSAKGLLVAMPFDLFKGTLALGGEHFARIDTLELTGPMLDAKATGNVAHSPQRGNEALAVDLAITPRGEGVEPILANLGIRTRGKGPTQLKITGTLSRPTFR